MVECALLHQLCSCPLVCRRHQCLVLVNMCRFVVVIIPLIVLSISGFPQTLATPTNFADVPCGQHAEHGVLEKQLRKGRIIGGVNASQGEFPWIVSLTRSGGHFCGGTIVNDRWVLTAAHCLCSGRDSLGTSSLRVTLGEHDLLVDADPQLPVSRVVLHPGFRCGRYDSDLALLKLKGSVPWSAAVLPACFPSSQPPPLEESSVTVAGWGWTHETSSQGVRSNTLQKVQLSVVDNLTCKAWYLSQGKKLSIKDSQMCAGLEAGGKDACWADSGGPLMMEEGEDTTIVGVVSTGVGCARPRLPGVYTRVSQFMPWISATLGETSG